MYDWIFALGFIFTLLGLAMVAAAIVSHEKETKAMMERIEKQDRRIASQLILIYGLLEEKKHDAGQ